MVYVEQSDRDRMGDTKRTALRALGQLWQKSGLDPEALSHVRFTGPTYDPFTSSFQIGALAQATIAASALSATEIWNLRYNQDNERRRTAVAVVDLEGAAAEFRSEQSAALNGRSSTLWDELNGIYKTKTGHFRPHTNWLHHKVGFLRELGLDPSASKSQVQEALLKVDGAELAEQCMSKGQVVASFRSLSEWDESEQGRTSAMRKHVPLSIKKMKSGEPLPFTNKTSGNSVPDKAGLPLQGIRVLELTRVLAGPVAGRTLAAYGADVLWVTAPHLPGLPLIDADTSRGKRTIQIDLRNHSDVVVFKSLLEKADVFLQGYRPGGLAKLGFSIEEVLKINANIVYAEVSAYGPDGPWKDRKGFDSLVQFATGINHAEGEAWRDFQSTSISTGPNENARGEVVPKVLPCQALDHATGYLLAFGIQTALYRRATEGGAYHVDASLLNTAIFLRSLRRTSFQASQSHDELNKKEELLRNNDLLSLQGWEGNKLDYVPHAAKLQTTDGEDIGIGWKSAPTGYNADEPIWLSG